MPIFLLYLYLSKGTLKAFSVLISIIKKKINQQKAKEGIDKISWTYGTELVNRHASVGSFGEDNLYKVNR